MKVKGAIVCYDVWTGDGSGTYDATASYDRWADAVKDIRAALDHGRDVLIQRDMMTQAEYDALDDTPDDVVRRLRGESSS